MENKNVSNTMIHFHIMFNAHYLNVVIINNEDGRLWIKELTEMLKIEVRTQN